MLIRPATVPHIQYGPARASEICWVSEGMGPLAVLATLVKR
jgi:hypothetical protein